MNRFDVGVRVHMSARTAARVGRGDQREEEGRGDDGFFVDVPPEHEGAEAAVEEGEDEGVLVLGGVGAVALCSDIFGALRVESVTHLAVMCHTLSLLTASRAAKAPAPCSPASGAPSSGGSPAGCY